MSDEMDHGSPSCPYLEAGDLRCGHRFTLPRMDQAFGVCMSGWRSCPIYLMLTREQAQRENHSHAIQVTVRHGEYLAGRVGTVGPLRPTGS
ncbi:MAG: hypothetical protein IT445_02285 [Phycisphaeraceae bacterium]|nr:hypothetical protein [Phycisphaeraceae bacterium]